VNKVVVSQHAEEASFLWTLRNRAVREPHYSLHDLSKLDERVEAHLDGLRNAADAGWNVCRSNVADQGPAGIFPLAVLAFGSGDRERMLEVLTAGCSTDETFSALVSAMGWLEYDVISPWLLRLLEAKLSVHRAVGVRGTAIHRRDPGQVLTASIDDVDASLRARALRAAGELKRLDLIDHVARHLKDEDDSCRFWAAWSLILLGESTHLSALSKYIERDDGTSVRALNVVLRAVNVDEGRRRVTALVKEPRLLRLGVMGAGILGDPVSVPWLIKKAELPSLARLAGEAFTMITGASLSYLDLDQDAPPTAPDEGTPIEEILDLGYDSNLPWPSSDALTRWWNDNNQRFSSGSRYLNGATIDAASLANTLTSGFQRQREAAALELAILETHRPFFEIRARGSRQQQLLGVSTW
jgi:uncharacterized protein (TIGR02270 family)